MPAASPITRSRRRRRRSLAATVSALLCALVLAPAALAVPTNDNQAAPFNVDLTTGDPVTVDTTGATIEAGELLTVNGGGVCNPGARQMVATTWYRIIGNGGVVSIDTTGSAFDTVISVYRAPTPSLADGLPCNDDAGGLVTSAVSFQSDAGAAYLIQVGGCDCGAAVVKEGLLTMHATAAAPPPPPTPPAPPAPPPIVVTPPDTDGDGIPDARDLCPTVRPTRDANNDGCQDKPIRILSDLKYDGSFVRRGGAIRGISLSRVRLTRVPTGAVVRVSCASCRRAVRGGSRAFRGFSLTAKKGGTQTMGRLSRLLLTRGKQIVVVVTAPDHLGRRVVVRFAGGRDRVTLSCLAPGSRSARVACSTGS
jgi:hypothetical protein